MRYRVLRADISTDRVCDVRISRHGERLLVTLRDVTEREASEQGIRRSEKSLRALVDGVFDEALITVDPTGTVLSWNTGAERIFGYPAGQMIGRHSCVLYPRGWPVSGSGESVGTVAGERLHETWQVRKDGRRFWASVSITAMHGDNGELRGFFSVTRDLTEESEQRRRDLQFSLVRALTDCADVDAAADIILELTTYRIGATFSEMFVLHPEQARRDSTSRHAFPRATPRCARRRGGRRVRSARRTHRARADHGHAGHRPGPQPARDVGADCHRRIPGGARGDRMSDRHSDGHCRRARVFLRDPASVETLTAEASRDRCRGRPRGHQDSRAGALREEALRMAELASTDRLTGLKNRREFDRILGTIPGIRSRSSRSMSPSEACERRVRS